MVEKIAHIKNPLTVIAMFAAIAEISGTTVLPFINAQNQSIYIWFLMFFPIFIVGIFFLTLNFNYRVLYAPSDYKDEKNFVNPFGKASPEEQEKKLREEVEEIEAENSVIKDPSNEPEKSSEPNYQSDHMPKADRNKARQRQVMADVALAEKLAINKLSKKLGLNLKTDAEIFLPDYGINAVYDGLGINDKEVHAVEVKLFKAKSINPSRLINVFEQSVLVSEHFSSISSREFTLHIFAVLDTPDIEMVTLKDQLNTFSLKYKVKTKIHITTLNELQNEYQYTP